MRRTSLSCSGFDAGSRRHLPSDYYWTRAAPFDTSEVRPPLRSALVESCGRSDATGDAERRKLGARSQGSTLGPSARAGVRVRDVPAHR